MPVRPVPFLFGGKLCGMKDTPLGPLVLVG